MKVYCRYHYSDALKNIWHGYFAAETTSEGIKEVNIQDSCMLLENIKITNAPAFRAILFALMSVFSTKTFLIFKVSFSLRNF